MFISVPPNESEKISVRTINNTKMLVKIFFILRVILLYIYTHILCYLCFIVMFLARFIYNMYT